MAPTVVLDLRYLQNAFRHSRDGGLGGMGVYSRGLWREVVAQRPGWRYVAVGDHGPVPPQFRKLVDGTGHRTIAPRGLAGRRPFPLRLNETRYGWILNMLESEVGWGSPGRGLPEPVSLMHGLSQLPPPRAIAFPTVTTIYDLIPFGAAGSSISSAITRARRAYLARIRRSERFLCISESTRRDLLAMTDIDPSRTRVAYPGLDGATFRPLHCPDAELTDRYAIEPPYFLNVGVCFGRKNPSALLAAFARVVRSPDGRRASLVFVGPYDVIPGAARRIKRQAADLGVGERIRLIGNVDDDDLARLYTNSAALVFPSLYEGFGYPALESLACGTPAIVSGTSSLPEAVGPLGRLVNPRQTGEIAAAMLDRLRELPGGRVDVEGPAWAGRFSWKAAAGACIGVYEELIG